MRQRWQHVPSTAIFSSEAFAYNGARCLMEANTPTPRYEESRDASAMVLESPGAFDLSLESILPCYGLGAGSNPACEGAT